MITMLWVLSVASIMTVVAALAGRNSFNAARNRVQLERAFWAASGCAERARESIDAALESAGSFEDAAQVWRMLDRRTSSPDHSDCDVLLEAAGTRLDLNSASEEMVDRFLVGLAYADTTAHAMSEALADWRDTDSVARPDGAEADWYTQHSRELPRNGPIADVRELMRVRGFENTHAIQALLTTDAGRVSLATAPPAVLLAVPGITQETADVLASLHEAGHPVLDLLSVVSLISQSSAELLVARYPDAIRVTTTDPDAWTIIVRARQGFPRSEVTLRWRVVRNGKRGIVVSTRTDS